MKTFQFKFIWAAILLAAVIGLLQHSFAAFAALLVATAFVNAGFHPSHCLRLTLSVNEISQLVIDAFKGQTPELFGPGGFAMDMSSKTAVLGDKVTAHIASVPTAADYDSSPGGLGFENGLQDSTDLLSDVPVTLSYLKFVPIRIKWLSGLASKIALVQGLAEQAFALRKLVIDAACQTILSSNFTHQYPVDPANVNLDTIEALRSKGNLQKMGPMGRFGIVNTPFASSLQADQRVGSQLFYQQLNGGNAYRRYTNLAGFGNVYEYPDFPSTGNLEGYFGDRRGIIIAVRAIDYSNAAEALKVPRTAAFTSAVDSESGLPFTAVGYEKQTNGDVVFSLGLLFGVAAGNQGGAADTITDRAGIRVVTSGSNV
jgi:hypothetical protein